MLATQHIRFDEYTKRQIDVIEEKELEKDEQYICRRIRDSRTSCLRCETLSKQCNNLKQKLDKVTNELELLKKYSTDNSLPRRQNTTPITILLSIANDETITNDIYDLLDSELNLVTQCQMLLHKNESLVNKELNKIIGLQPHHISTIKCVINNYYDITQCIYDLDSKQDQFIFYVIWHSISICGRIQDVVTKEYWKCVDYLTTFIYNDFTNFESYVSRFIPLKLPCSIIEDVCREYKLYNHNQFLTLKDVISSWANKTMNNNEYIMSQVAQVTQVICTTDNESNTSSDDIVFDDELPILIDTNDNDIEISEYKIEDITPESNDESMLNDLDQLQMTLNVNAQEFIYNPIVTNTNTNTNTKQNNIIPKIHLAAINEDTETPKIEEILSPITQPPSDDCNSDLQSPKIETETETKIETKNEIEYKYKYKNNNNKNNNKPNGRAENKFFIAPELISKISNKCVEEFNTSQINDEGLLFDYIKQSISMQIYDKHINNEIQTSNGLIIILNIDLHFKDYQTMFLIATENDISFRNKMKWKIINFMRSYQICNEYNINSHKLPEPSRTRAPFCYGINTPPNNVPIDILKYTKFKQLPGKLSKKKNQTNLQYKNKERISENDLRYYCQRSWYNNIMIPVVVIKGKKQWIEWKKFIRINNDKYGKQQWIGISLRYYRSNKQWKIECMEYDSGRIYYQHRLIGNCNINNRYKYTYNQLTKYITTQLDIY